MNDFLQQNEIKTNRLVLRLLWVASLVGLVFTIILNLVGFSKVETSAFIISFVVTIVSLIIGTIVLHYYQDRKFVKYMIAVAGMITILSIIISTGEGLQLSFLWFFSDCHQCFILQPLLYCIRGCSIGIGQFYYHV